MKQLRARNCYFRYLFLDCTAGNRDAVLDGSRQSAVSVVLFGKDFLNIFQCFAFGFGQNEEDEDHARHRAAHEEPEGSVGCHRDLHHGETSYDGKCAHQIERRAERGENGAVSRWEKFAHKNERDVGISTGIGDEEDDEREKRKPTQFLCSHRRSPLRLHVEECPHGCQ